jgi:hypothetical protein
VYVEEVVMFERAPFAVSMMRRTSAGLDATTTAPSTTAYAGKNMLDRLGSSRYRIEMPWYVDVRHSDRAGRHKPSSRCCRRDRPLSER